MLSDFSAFVHYLKRYCFNLSRTLIYLTAQADTGIAEHGPCPRVSDRDFPGSLVGWNGVGIGTWPGLIYV